MRKKILRTKKTTMPIKAVPVPIPEEPSEVPEEPKSEEAPEAPKKKQPAPKSKAAQAAVKAAAKAQQKAWTAMAKEQEKLDMKTRVKCGICRRTVSQHCLLYTHKCPQAALDAKPKTPTVEEKFPDPPPRQNPPVEEPVDEAPPPPEPLAGRPKKVRIKQPPPPPVIPEYEESTTSSSSDDFVDSYSSRSYTAWNAPPPPALERQPSRQPYPDPKPTYREILLERQRAKHKERAMAQVGPIRGHFRY